MQISNCPASEFSISEQVRICVRSLGNLECACEAGRLLNCSDHCVAWYSTHITRCKLELFLQTENLNNISSPFQQSVRQPKRKLGNSTARQAAA